MPYPWLGYVIEHDDSDFNVQFWKLVPQVKFLYDS